MKSVLMTISLMTFFAFTTGCLGPDAFTPIKSSGELDSSSLGSDDGNVNNNGTDSEDKEAPHVELDSTPAALDNETSASVEFSSPDLDVAGFECRLDDEKFSSCTNPFAVDNLDDGPHTIEVRAKDKSGNISQSASASFIVDTKAPSLSLKNVNVSGASATIKTNASDENGLDSYECRLDDKPFESCGKNITYTELSEGTHTVTMVVIDKAGNPSDELMADFEIKSSGGSEPTNNIATLSWDPNGESDLAGYKIHFGMKSGSYTKTVDIGLISVKNNRVTYVIKNLTPGETYYFAVTAYNKDGLESGFSNEAMKAMPSTTMMAAR